MAGRERETEKEKRPSFVVLRCKRPIWTHYQHLLRGVARRKKREEERTDFHLVIVAIHLSASFSSYFLSCQ